MTALRMIRGERRPDALPLVGRGHVLNVRPTHPTTRESATLSRHDWTLLLAALHAPGVARSLAEVGDRIAAQVADECSPYGIARPVQA